MRGLKLSFVLIGMALLAAVVAGCGGGGGGENPPQNGLGLVTVNPTAKTATFTPTEGTTVNYIFGEFHPISPLTNPTLQNVEFTPQPNGSWTLSFTDSEAFSNNPTGSYSGTFSFTVYALVPGNPVPQTLNFTANPGSIQLMITITSDTSPPPPPIFQ